MYFNLFAPLIVAILFLNPLLEASIVPDYLQVGNWKVLRVALTVLAICMRMLTFREEI